MPFDQFQLKIRTLFIFPALKWPVLGIVCLAIIYLISSNRSWTGDLQNLQDLTKRNLKEFQDFANNSFAHIKDDLESLGNFSRHRDTELQDNLKLIHGFSGAGIDQLNRNQLEDRKSFAALLKTKFETFKNISDEKWSVLLDKVVQGQVENKKESLELFKKQHINLKQFVMEIHQPFHRYFHWINGWDILKTNHPNSSRFRAMYLTENFPISNS